jgi:hypothetical protein
MQTTASESVSWFGPLGLLLVGGAALAGVALWRRRALPPLTVLLAVAPVIWLVLVSLTIGYDIWQGRFFMYPVALSAVLWGLILRAAPLAWAAVAIASTTVVLSFVNSIEKPSGVQLFADRPTPSVWRMERWEAQSYLRPRVAPVLRFLETRIPDDATVALALSEDEFGYPAFGAGLERRVELVELDSPATGMRATWLVAGRRRAAEIDSSCWTTALETKGGTVFRRHQTCLLPSSSE